MQSAPAESSLKAANESRNQMPSLDRRGRRSDSGHRGQHLVRCRRMNDEKGDHELFVADVARDASGMTDHRQKAPGAARHRQPLR
jgi:hypothetical protein